MYELIVTEKPQASKKIAEALCDGKPVKEDMNGVPYYKITRGKKDIVVACAVGHLYGLEQKEGKKWSYPIFDIEWQASYETKKESAFTKKYLTALKKLSKDAKEFTVATDYDIEGEVIGLNVIRYACKQKDANRMKFSTLTKEDLIKAYETKEKTLNWGQAKAGETRHFLDYYNGINYSRALTSAIRSTGAFKIMSIGRVQGPALRIIVQREKEIRAFRPESFWQIEIIGKAKTGQLRAWHEKDKFWKKEEATAIFEKVKDEKEANVQKIESARFSQAPPTPFDLTTLQTECYRCHRIAPKKTLEIAQELYTAGSISYPRTSSQVYPESIGYRKILSLLSKNNLYKDLAEQILSKKVLAPNNGKKTDPAHPAIYPTGAYPEIENEMNMKVYDIIAKRFLATFAEPAMRETNKIILESQQELFVAKGTRTVEKGWHVFYMPYVNLEEEDLPKVVEKECIPIKKIEMYDRETTPPKRYTPASIIRELEKKNLGTKSTRAAIVDTLFQRGYAQGKAIEATELGIRTIETLEKHSPKIIDEELTRHFEDEMEDISLGKKKEEEVLSEARDAINRILLDLKTKEKEIGKELHAANIETRDKNETLGKCPFCENGMIKIRKGKFGRFAACNSYPDCKTTYSLPSTGIIEPMDKVSEKRKIPYIRIINKGKRPAEVCLDPEENQVITEEHREKEGKECPKCKQGKLTIRKSIYGSFIACDRYPKCKYIEQIGGKQPRENQQESSPAAD